MAVHKAPEQSGMPEQGVVHCKYHQYQVVGRLKPSAQYGTRKSDIFKMNVFAPNKIVAKSRFWYYMSMLNRVKKANGEILQINEVFEKKPQTVSTYGIWMRYDSRTGHHNMYREYRHVSINNAVSKMYQDVATSTTDYLGNKVAFPLTHRVIRPSRKTSTTDYLGNKVAFPLSHRVIRPSSKTFKKTFVARRPRTCFDH
eukprot:CAMPEP_0180208116 /NCGR_PEP_ID=MMETSP0987-20121128/10559_1 /TAXON_ID=697907 /ORGANISM="non described non described, Strain CCMP2293" /LENGTH=198 /DNA_ID=CAMNT_0022164223 /DNA_START=25 /DNA_END=621 /DNA_ORIENTATION=-